MKHLTLSLFLAVTAAFLGTCEIANAAKLYASGGEYAKQIYRFDISGPNDAPSPELIITNPNFETPQGLAISPINGELFVMNARDGGYQM